MDMPPPVVIGLEGLIKHSLPRIIKIRNTAAAMTNFGRLSPFLKRLQVSVLLLGTIYRKLSQYDMIPGSDMCLGICHDSLVQTQGMIEAVLQADDAENVYNVGTGVLVERLPEEINSFISSVELLRSTYHEAQAEFILESMRELTNLRRDYSKHLQECTQIQDKGLHPTIVDTSSEDEQTSSSDNGTSLTEPEISSPPDSPGRKPVEEKAALVGDMAVVKEEPNHPVLLPEAHVVSVKDIKLEQPPVPKKEAYPTPEESPSTIAITILGTEHDSTSEPKAVHGRAIVEPFRDNWVSLAMLKRAKLDGKVMDADHGGEQGEPPTFNGCTLRRQGTIELTWSLGRGGNESKAKTTLFSVFDNLPVDVILTEDHNHEKEGQGIS